MGTGRKTVGAALGSDPVDRKLDDHLPSMSFALGRVFATRGVLCSIPSADVLLALRRHAAKDWGNVDSDGAKANEGAIATGARVLSAYTVSAGIRFWVITEADRSSTTVLLPEEY